MIMVQTIQSLTASKVAIAMAIRTAYEVREGSWIDGVGRNCGHYRMTLDEAVAYASLDADIAALVSLLLSWTDDSLRWSDKVLADAGITFDLAA